MIRQAAPQSEYTREKSVKNIAENRVRKPAGTQRRLSHKSRLAGAIRAKRALRDRSVNTLCKEKCRLVLFAFLAFHVKAPPVAYCI
jgi:hypothetical protein